MRKYKSYPQGKICFYNWPLDKIGFFWYPVIKQFN